MRASIVACVVLWCGTARAEFPPPIALKSAVASGAKADKETWKVVATNDGHWCQANLSPSETFTIELGPATPIASVVMAVDKSVASAEIVADGTSFKGTSTV